MTGTELRTIRLSLALTQLELGRALGYRMTDKNLRDHVCKLEARKEIPFQVAIIAKSLIKAA